MSDVSIAKRKEKCENCTKQVSVCICVSSTLFYVLNLSNFFSLLPHSATRNRVTMVPTPTRREKKSTDR